MEEEDVLYFHLLWGMKFGSTEYSRDFWVFPDTFSSLLTELIIFSFFSGAGSNPFTDFTLMICPLNFQIYLHQEIAACLQYPYFQLQRL